MAQDLHLAYFGKDANEWDLNMYPDRRRRITHWPSSKGKNNRRLNVDLIIPRQPVVRKRLGQVTQLAPSVHEHQVPTAPDTTEKPLLLEEMERLAASLSCIADGVTDEREQWMLKLKGTCSILEALSKHFRQYSHILLTPILTVESFIRWHVQQEPLANFSPLPPKEQDKSRLFIRQNSRAEDKGAIPEQVKEMEETIRNLKEQHYKELAGVSASLEGCVLEVRAQLEESEENVSTLKKTLRRVERRAHDLSHSEEVLKSEVQDLQQRLEELKIELDDAKHKRRKSNVPDWMNKRRSRAVSLAQWEENADDPLPRKVKRLNLSEEEMKKLITQFIEYRQNRQMERPIHEDYFLWMTRVMKGYTKTLQVACSISLACTDHEEDFMFSTFYDILTESTSAEVITASLEYSTKVLDTVMQIDHDCEAEAFHSEALKYLTTLTWLSTTEHDALIETLPHGKCVTTEGLKDLEEGILWSYTDKAKSFVTSIVTSLGALAKVEGDKHDLVSVVSVIKALAPNTTIKTIEEHIRSVVRITGRESTLSLSNLCSMLVVSSFFKLAFK